MYLCVLLLFSCVFYLIVKLYMTMYENNSVVNNYNCLTPIITQEIFNAYHI